MNHLIGKTVKTRGGFDVEIIAVKPELKQPIIGILHSESVDDQAALEQWYMDGSYCEHETKLLDLVLEEPEKLYDPYEEIYGELLKYTSITGNHNRDVTMFIYKEKWEEIAQFGVNVIEYFSPLGKAYLKPGSFQKGEYSFE